MKHSNAARTLHRPTTAPLEALAADAVLSGSAQDMAYALSRLSMPPVEAIVSAPRVLHRAASADFPRMVKSLIKLGVSPSARNEDGTTPLHSAATNMDRDTIKALLSSGKRKPVLPARDVVGNTPLHAVFREIHTVIPDGAPAPAFLSDTLSILVESGASLSVRNNQC